MMETRHSHGLPDGLDPRAAVTDPIRAQTAAALDRAAVALAPALDAVAAVAHDRLGGTIALVTLIDDHRQLVRGRAPLDATPRLQAPDELPVAHTFCPYTIAAHGVVLVDDLAADIRTRTNPVVDAGARAYAGAPVIVDGEAVGTVCVLDEQPRRWTDDDGDILRRLAQDVAFQLTSQRYRTSAP